MSSVLDRLAAALADRYRVTRELGAGGMATVYLAHDLKHEREPLSILDLQGLGKSAWTGFEATAHVDAERRAWD